MLVLLIRKRGGKKIRKMGRLGTEDSRRIRKKKEQRDIKREENM
jgi:hypothetical protein